MAAYCLPRQLSSKFLAALKDGTVNPQKLADMTSGERRKFFDDLVGAENAEDVNALFESKLLLKNQKQGLVTWAKTVAGISEPTRRDLLTKINKLDKVLKPAEEREFLSDLAAQKLGVTVTADEAKEIFDLAKTAEDAKAVMKGNGWTPENGTAYGRALIDLTEKVESLKPNGRTWGQFGLEVANIPRGIMSTLDLSAPLNQGWGMEASGNWRDAFGRMFKYYADEENYKDLRGYILGHPDFEAMDKAGLSLTELGQKLSAREETIQTTLVEKAFEYGLTKTTGIPNLVRASNRAYTGYLNYVRFKTMQDWMAAARLAGEDVSVGSQLNRDFAKAINNFSGRGEIGGERASNLVTGLNAVFFAPRKTIGTIQMFNPVNMLNPKIGKLARIKATKMLLGSILYTGAAIGLARAMGADVDVDPRSTDFLKIQIGKTKFDITGGNAIYLRFLARMATNQEVNSAGKLIELGEGYGKPTRADVLLQFLRGKLAPVAAFMADALYGKDPVGRPFTVTQEARDKLMPMTIGNYVDFVQNDPGNMAAVIPAIAAIFGLGMQSPLPGVNNNKYDVWGTPNGTVHDQPLDRTLTRLGIQLNQPEKMIRGVKLTDAQYEVYQQYYGKMIRATMSAAIQTPGFDRWPLGAQENALKAARINGAERARDVMLSKNTRIITEADRLKREQFRQGSPAAVARRAAQ